MSAAYVFLYNVLIYTTIITGLFAGIGLKHFFLRINTVISDQSTGHQYLSGNSCYGLAMSNLDGDSFASNTPLTTVGMAFLQEQ